jgi:hypothetical protein
MWKEWLDGFQHKHNNLLYDKTQITHEEDKMFVNTQKNNLIISSLQNTDILLLFSTK